MNKAFLFFSLICAYLCCNSCSEVSESSLESKLIGDWVISTIDYVYHPEWREGYYYNWMIYSLSFKENGSVEIFTGDYLSDDDLTKENIMNGRTKIVNYYVEDGVVYVGFDKQVRDRDNASFKLENGMLVWEDRWYNSSQKLIETYIVHYKKQ